MDDSKLALIEKKIEGLIGKIGQLKEENAALAGRLEASEARKDEVRARLEALAARLEKLDA